MTSRLSFPWPGGGLSQPVRILAASDEPDPALDHAPVRDDLRPIDLVVGCGDLEPHVLAMLGDAFMAPLVYVRGNHDRGLGWHEHQHLLPSALPDARPVAAAGLTLAGLSWPGAPSGRAQYDDAAAWGQALRLVLRAARRRPDVLVTHVPPAGIGDTPTDPYHRGFRAYRWVAERLRPRLWLHGHTHPAAADGRLETLGPTTFINVTGSTLVELTPT